MSPGKIHEIEQRLIGCRQATAEANADLEAARAKLRTAQATLHVPSIDIYRARYDEACERVSECEAVERRLVEQVYEQRTLAPRLFKVSPAVDDALSAGAQTPVAADRSTKTRYRANTECRSSSTAKN